MKVLVTGATGVYGRALVERLALSGHDVVAMARNPPKSLPSGVTFSAGDVADGAAVQRAMRGCDAVAHLAFVVKTLRSEEETRAINLGGTQNVLDAMEACGTRRLVFASSSMSYGANPDNPPLFTEAHEQRPAPDFLYGSHKKAAEALIRDSGVDAVMTRTPITVGRNVDNLLIDIFAAPSIVGVKDTDSRWQLVHQDDVGRFLALACEDGPAGPVNVSPPDFLTLEEIARVVGRRYTEVSEAQLMRAVEFIWDHELAATSPAEARGVAFMPRLDTTRLREEWGFECAWSTAEAALDVRRAVRGLVAVAENRISVPWRIRYPQYEPGDLAGADEPTLRPARPAPTGSFDTPVSRSLPTYRRATTAPGPLEPLTLTVHAHLVRAATTGLLMAAGVEDTQARKAGAATGGVFGHRLYVNAGLDVSLSRARRAVLARRYASEIGWLTAAGPKREDVEPLADAKLEARLVEMRDHLSWLWTTVAVGDLLADTEFSDLDALMTLLPDGRALSDTARVRGDREVDARRCVQAAARESGQRLARLVAERGRRLQDAGALDSTADVAFLTWAELLVTPPDAAERIERRRREHATLAGNPVPRTVSGWSAVA